MPDPSALQRPGFARYLACLVYESLLVLAWLFIIGVVFLALKAGIVHRWPGGTLQLPTAGERSLLQAWFGLGLAAYFVFFWVRSGQTLAMKTWKIKLVSLDGRPVQPLQALARLAVAAMAIPLFGLAWLWALRSPSRLWLHDQLSKTRLVRS